ncbi:MAG: PepSY domain-containing protein [Dehalococcoidia bacterium]
MFKSLPGRLVLGSSVVALLAIAATTTTLATQGAFAGGNNDDDGEAEAAPGTLDDGKELLPEAKVSIEDAIAAAKGAATGNLGEVDLEYWKTGLVFNVDIGDADVKVDALTGQVVGVETDGE